MTPLTFIIMPTGVATEKNLTETPGLGPEVRTEVKNKPNGRRKLPFFALETPGKVMVGSVGFEPTTSCNGRHLRFPLACPLSPHVHSIRNTWAAIPLMIRIRMILMIRN